MIRPKSVAAALFAIVAMLGIVPGAYAAGGTTTAAAGTLAHIKGTVSDFNAIQITIKTKGADVKAVRLTENTKYFLNGDAVGHRPELQKGEKIRVLAFVEQDGSLTARIVALGRADKNDRVRVNGTISDFNAISLTIKTKDGDVRAAKLTENTKYYVAGKLVDHRPEFDKGQRVSVVAHMEQDGSLTALIVKLATAKKHDRVRIAGTISDFNAISLTINIKGDVKAVRLTENTKYYVNGKLVGQRPEFDKGQHVVVLANKEQDGSLTALVVKIGPADKLDRVRLAGTISDSNAISLTILQAGDVKAVRLTDKTQYLVNGQPAAQRPELDKGARVRVTARKETDGSLTALVVAIRNK